MEEEGDNCCGTVSESDQQESTPTGSDLDSEYSLHDSESEDEDEEAKINVSINSEDKSLKENRVLGVVFEPFLTNTTLSDLGR